MEISTQIVARLISVLAQDEPAETKNPLLVPGRVVEVRVVSPLAKDQVLLKVADQELVARNPAGLVPGQKVQVQVQAALPESDEIILKLLDLPALKPGPAVQLKTALPGQTPLGPALARLAEVLPDLPVRVPSPLAQAVADSLTSLKKSLIQPGQNLQASLKSLWSRLGLDLEASLAKGLDQPRPSAEPGLRLAAQQLKPRLLALAQELAPAASRGRGLTKTYPPLTRVVARLKTVLDLIQARPAAGPASEPPPD
ncbi:MAG: hypothetical protein JRJ59_09840, partial [Deltaproteobacteria bacterium]|nr:hypothetical protein [Deltaproteobacteria bacterium]